MRVTGADGLVVARNPGNAGGAKGPDFPANEACQPARGGTRDRGKAVSGAAPQLFVLWQLGETPAAGR